MNTRVLIVAWLALPGTMLFGQESPPIVNASMEQKLLVEKTPDGGLPPAVGVQNIQVFRATRVPEFEKDDRGWTYNHHMDLAIWKGHYLIAFTNGKVDEDVPPDHQLYTYSTDGIEWTWPEELFPQGTSGSTRMYWYHTTNGRLVAVASLKVAGRVARNSGRLLPREPGDNAPEPKAPAVDPSRRGGLIAREIFADLKPGTPYILQKPSSGDPVSDAPMFDTSRDKGLVEAFRQVLGNHLFLEQEDYGKFLGSDRMSAYEGMDDNFGKAFCFYYRKDGTLVGVAKNSWVVTSPDKGKTWSKPVTPKGHITNNAKVWVQPTPDGKYVMIYNPTLRDRFPMVVMTSDDGITFRDMRVVHGEVPQERYPGMFKNPGPQYFRGVSMFDDDGSMKGDGKSILMVYSVNKEDIWVSRIPVPIKVAETGPVSDHFDGPAREGFLVPDWNVYSPRWAPVKIVDAASAGGSGGKAMQLEDRDPYDYARASRVFKDGKQATVRFRVTAKQLGTVTGENPLEVDVTPAFGTARPVRLQVTPDKRLMAYSGPRRVDLGSVEMGKALDISMTMDCLGRTEASPTDSTYSADGTPVGTWTINVNGKSTALAFAEPAAGLAKLVIRTGAFRTTGTPVSNGQPTYPTPVDPATDKPVEANTFWIQDVEIQ